MAAAATANTTTATAQAVKDESVVRVTYHGQAYEIPMEFVMKKHWGGPKVILKHKDGDISAAFDRAKHPPRARQMLEEWIADPNLSPEKKAALKRRAEEREAWDAMWLRRGMVIGVVAITVAATWWLMRSAKPLPSKE